MFNFFASAEGPGVPLAAEPVVHLGPLAITNSMLFGMITAVAVLVLFAMAARRTSLRPKSKFAFTIETVVEFLLNIAQENFGGDRKKALKHLPLLLTLFTFILISNLSGLLPGVGTVMTQTPEGEVPLLRAFTTDLNATLALAVLSIGLVQFYAIKELGILGHLKHYFTDKPWNPMNLFIGLIEVMGEFIRILTLSMRLFGVIYAGEVLLHVIGELAGNFGWAATIPVYLMEIFFSAIQAYLFVMLTTVYLSIATSHTDEAHPVGEDEAEHSRAREPKLAAADASVK
ncbi:MAG: F0F1 ATP synthase subunit A [Candidatus Saccharimonadales bacterium]